MSTKNERVKELRLYLNLNQKVFGEKLDIADRSVGLIETGKNTLTDRNINAICRVFNVREEWLREGTGEMFNPPVEKSFLDKLAEEKGLDAREKALIESIIELPPNVRGAVIDWAIAFVKKLNALPEDSAKEKRLREIEQQQKELEEEKIRLTGGVSPCVEDLSIEAG